MHLRSSSLDSRMLPERKMEREKSSTHSSMKSDQCTIRTICALCSTKLATLESTVLSDQEQYVVIVSKTTSFHCLELPFQPQQKIFRSDTSLFSPISKFSWLCYCDFSV